jgi:hypothetical protein
MASYSCQAEKFTHSVELTLRLLHWRSVPHSNRLNKERSIFQ